MFKLTRTLSEITGMLVSTSVICVISHRTEMMKAAIQQAEEMVEHKWLEDKHGGHATGFVCRYRDVSFRDQRHARRFACHGRMQTVGLDTESSTCTACAHDRPRAGPIPSLLLRNTLFCSWYFRSSGPLSCSC